MGTVRRANQGTDSTLRFGQWVLLLGCFFASLPVYASFLPVDLGVVPRIEPMATVLHLAAGICAIGLVVAFLESRDQAIRALAHPIVLLAFAVALWSAVVAPFSDYPWMSLLGGPVYGEGAARYASLAVFFTAAIVLAGDRRMLRLLCVMLVIVSFVTPIIIYALGKEFFVSLDLVGQFAISAAVATWFLTDGRQLSWRWALALLSVLPGLALSTNHSVIVVLTFAVAMAAAAHWLLTHRTGVAAMLRLFGILAVVSSLFIGLLLKWLLPEILDVGSVLSRHLLDRVLLAALMDNPLMLSIGQGWGAINLTMDSFAPHSGAVMWDKSWDLSDRNIFHSHSTFLEALFGAGLPAMAGLIAMFAAPLVVVSSARLPLALFVSLTLAGLAALTWELPSTVGAVALAFALASARTDEVAEKRAALRAGRMTALLMPVVASLLLTASFWQFHEANTTRIRIAEVRAQGHKTPHGCDLHPYSALSADIRLAHGLVASHRPIFELVTNGGSVSNEDARQIDAYVCTAEARISENASASLLLAMESFRVAVALGDPTLDLHRRYRASLDNWAEKLVRVLTVVPERTEVANGYFLAQIQRGNLYTVGSLADALLKRNPEDPVAMWYLGLARVGSGEPSVQVQGKQLLDQALDGGVRRLLPIDSDLIEQVRAFQPDER